MNDRILTIQLGSQKSSDTYIKTMGFTIVELLVVIVVIGILATLTILAYDGIQNRAKVGSLQSELSQAAKQLETYKVTHDDVYPDDLETIKIVARVGIDYSYQKGNRTYCLSAKSDGVSYYVTHSKATPSIGICSGILANGDTCPADFIAVPGNSTFSTSDFCVMKYEARRVGTTKVPISQAAGTPWQPIDQIGAAINSANVAGCVGCHLITEAEWLTIAHDVLSVPSNWSNNTVGAPNFIYSGHSDNVPAAALTASADDDGYNGTGQTSGGQRRTLTLTNGEVIWDLAGNVNEWTAGTIAGSSQPGISGEVSYSWKNYNSGSLIQNGLPDRAMPSFGTSAASGWTSGQGIGQLYSNYGESVTRSFLRGGYWGGGANAGVLGLFLLQASNASGPTIGFRVAR